VQLEIAAAEEISDLLHGEVDGSADLAERLEALCTGTTGSQSEVEHDNESTSDEEIQSPEGPPRKRKRERQTQAQRDTAATAIATSVAIKWRQKNPCKCEHNCLWQFQEESLLREMVHFRLMSEEGRAVAVRYVLAALASPPGEENTLLKATTCARARRHRGAAAYDQRGRIAYAWHGKVVCQPAFCAVVQVGRDTVLALAAEVRDEFEPMTPRAPSATGRLSAQTTIVVRFIRAMAARHAMRNPSARSGVAPGERCRWYFMSHNTKTVLFLAYKEQYPVLVAAAIEAGVISEAAKASTSPVQSVTFFNLWRKMCPEVRIFNKGSDFCDYCTAFRNNPTPTDDELALFKLHVDAYQGERAVYTEVRQAVMTDGVDAGTIHLIFDFAGGSVGVYCFRPV